jgi:uncharacterized protein
MEPAVSLLLAWLIVALGLLAAAAGSILPGLPGAPLALAATIAAGYLTGFTRIDVGVIAWVAVLTLLSQGVELLGNLIGARRFGAGRAGTWGGVIGSLIGVVLLPPWGLLLGAGVGAAAFELLAGRPAAQAWRAGLGSLLGTLAGVGGKLVMLLAIAVVVIAALASAP